MKLLYEKQPDGGCQCHACGHECRISDGARGICGMRVNHGGRLEAAFGRVTGLAIDPMEKKPLYHYFPGTGILSFGGLGCNFKCAFCQNWQISQVGRDADARGTDMECTAEQIVATAVHYRVKAVAATYNEPLIRSEWVAEIMAQARKYKLGRVMVTNGFASHAALDALIPVVDAVNIDLKCFTQGGYRALGGRLDTVLDTIRAFCLAGKWVELTTLVVPGFNDSPAELEAIAAWIAGVSPDIPWHVSAWHEDYQWHPGIQYTTVEMLEKAVAAGEKAGLRYVYTGNIVGNSVRESTVCPECGQTVIQRQGYRIGKIALKGGCCEHCGRRIPGVFDNR